MVEGVGARSGVGGAVPAVVVAGSDHIGRIVVHADIEVERIGAGTANGIGIIIGIDAGSGVRNAMPSVAFAGILVVAVVGAVVDAEMERDGAIAASGIGLDKGGCGSARGVGYAMPGVAVAGGDGLNARVAVVDGKAV